MSSLRGKVAEQDVAVEAKLRLDGLRVRQNHLCSGGMYSFCPERYTKASRLGLLALREAVRRGATGDFIGLGDEGVRGGGWGMVMRTTSLNH